MPIGHAPDRHGRRLEVPVGTVEVGREHGVEDLLDDPPSLLNGRYLLGAEIGRGGSAVVFRARDCVLQRDVAIKALRDVLLDPQARSRFEFEGRILAGLDHPGLVSVFDAVTHDDHPFLVLELVEGHSLTERWRPERPERRELLTIGAELADVLAYVHAHGVAHRDVKPSNVLVGTDGRVRLTDFGIARLVEDASARTQTGMILGTAAYLAPEQVRGRAATGAADVYALGLVLLEGLRGRPVFSGAPDVAALARLISPPAIDDGLPPSLRSLLLSMTADQPAHRPSAADVRRRLHALADELDATRAIGLDAAPDAAPAAPTGLVSAPLTPAPLAPAPLTTGPLTRLSVRSRRPVAGLLAMALGAALVVALTVGVPFGRGAGGTARTPAGVSSAVSPDAAGTSGAIATGGGRPDPSSAVSSGTSASTTGPATAGASGAGLAVSAVTVGAATTAAGDGTNVNKGNGKGNGDNKGKDKGKG
jgi:tRNA A-37 threonylcarbamoyl transferase component Bud32